VDEVLQRFREEFAGAKKEIRVGVSRSVGLAYLPGFFHANIRRQPQIGYRVSYQSSAEVISSLETNRTDLGVLCPPPRLPATVRVTHKFTDAFTVISPADRVPLAGLATRRKQIEWASSQDWLLLDETSNTGRRLRKWLASQGVSKEPTMQLDSFDLLINLVALGMGVSCVPIRALALYVGKRNIRRIQLIERFTRELVVIVRRHRRIPEHLAGFIENILF
jgi:DNA-binding transcriptional LysR family regulator